MTFKIKETQY